MLINNYELSKISTLQKYFDIVTKFLDAKAYMKITELKQTLQGTYAQK
jgi:hypothetical protein